MNRILFAASFVSAGACASSGAAPSPDTRREHVQVQTSEVSYDIPLTVDTHETKAAFELPADSVWRAVPRAYAVMSIPTEVSDPAHRLFIGNATARVRFIGQPISKFVDCGSGITGPNADTYTVQFRLQAQVDSVAPGQSALRSHLEAGGTSSSGSAVRCATTGELERQFSLRVKLLALTGGGSQP